MEKSVLRKKYLEKRILLKNEEVISLSKQIFSCFIKNFNLIDGQKVHVFLPIQKKNEVDTSLFTNYFFENNIRVFVPKIIGDKMNAVEIFPSSEFVINTWGIQEPISTSYHCEMDFDMVITPLLYADFKGNRIGYGKGFYDYFFSQLLNNTQKIGLNFFPPLEVIDDVWEKDIPLDYLVTPTETLSFGNR